MARFTFIFPSRKVELVARVIQAIGVLNFTCWFLLSLAIGRWAPEQQSGSFDHIVFRGRNAKYVPAPVAIYAEVGFWAHFVILAANLGIPLLLGAQLRRDPP